jgi:hypothetical protein
VGIQPVLWIRSGHPTPSDIVTDHHCLTGPNERVRSLKRLVDATSLQVELHCDVGEIAQLGGNRRWSTDDWRVL